MHGRDVGTEGAGGAALVDQLTLPQPGGGGRLFPLITTRRPPQRFSDLPTSLHGSDK